MANEFKVKNGLIVIGDLTTSGTITINGALAATQSWVTSQSYLTSASLSGYATQSYVTSAISALIDAAPAALDTLNELAAALGDDASFSTTITNSIAGKMALYNGVGAPDFNTNITNGIYRNQGGANAPVSGSHFTMFSAFQPDGNYGWQLAASASDSLYFRFKDANFNSWVQLATRSWVTSQNYLTSYTDTLATVTSRGASTSTPVTFNGNVTLGNNADLVFQDLSGTFPTTGKGFDWTLNNDGARIYAVQPGSDSIDLVFQLRDNATTNDRFVFWVDEWQGPAYDKYPLIISGGTEFDLKDSSLYTNSVLRLSNSGVLQNVTGNISMFTNNAGYLTSESDTLATVTGRGATTSTNISVNTITIGTDATYGAAYRSVSFGYNGDGSNRILAANNTSDGMYFMAATGQGFNFRPNGGTANLVVINSTGNVGIGTTSPATPLHVTGGASGSGGWNRTATLAATYPGLIFNSNGTKWGGMAYDYSAAMRFWVNANNDDIFAGTLAMSILNNGNVGIGTSNPIYKLQVVGSAYVNGGTLFLDSSQYLRWGDSNQGIVGENNNGISIVAGGSTRQTIYADGRTYFPGLDLSISNVNSSHGTGTYFRGDGSHFVLGLNNGNTFYLNYGNGTGTLRTYGTWYHHDVQILSTSRVLTNVSGNISMFTNDAGYLTSVSDVWVNTTGDTMTGALTIQGGWASTILDGDNVVLRKPNYSSGGWARTLLNFQEYDTTSLFQIGGYGNNNTLTYGYLGSAYNTPTIKWYSDKNVYFSANVFIDDAADNNRFAKGSSFLNLRDPWNNTHLSTGSGGQYYDAAHFYFRSTGGGTSWLYLDSSTFQVYREQRNYARVEFRYNADRYSQSWYNTNTGAYWWVTTDSDKLGLHLNGDGDKFYFGNNGDFYSTANGWLSSALAAKQNASTAINTSNIGSQSVNYANSAGSATTSTQTYRGIIEDTRAGERTPNDYDDYRVSWEFTNQIPGLNYGGTSWWSVMTMQGWHNGYSAWQIIGSSSSAIDDFYLRAGNNTTWNTARRIWHSGDFSSTNVSNWNTAYGWGNHASAGYLTSYSETDTLASVTSRGNSTTNRINVRGLGNQGGGNIMMGDVGQGTNKWSYLTGTHYNASSQPQGFALIGGLSTDSFNAVVIGGNIYETNPATEIQFWTHSDTTHNLGGTQRGVINLVGNWGVGTTSPQSRLHVETSSSNIFRMVRGSTNFGFEIGGGAIGLYDYEDSVYRWYVDSIGNIGIGTTSPSYKLDVATGNDNAIRILNSLGSNNNGLALAVGSGTPWMDFNGSSFSIKYNPNPGSWNGGANNHFTILSGGNVGIGTTSPSSKLTVYSDTTADGILVDVLSRPRITLRDRGNSDTILGTGDYGLDDFFIDTYSGNAFAIKGSTRNVGIGTNSPTEKLHVNGDTRIVGNTYVGGIINAYQGDASIWVPNLGQAFTVKQTTGNVGVGTSSPSEKLHVSGAAIFDGGSGNSSTDSVVYITKSTNDDWGLYVNNAGLDYGMYTRTSPSANYAFAIHNGTTWTTRITGNAIIYLGEKDAIRGNSDSWLRLNNSNDYTSGVYTPGVMRADGGFYVSGSTVWHAGNDGSGSGLDADLLDGQNSTEFLRLLPGGAEASLDSYTDNGVRSVSFAGHSQHLLSWNAGGSTGTVQQLFHYNTPANGWKIRNKTDNSSWSSWGYVVMSSSNQGLISGTIATQSYVTTQINNLINGAPGALDTLSELASALGNDASFATTVTNSIAGKVSKTGDTMTGALTIQNGVSATWDYMTLEHPGPYARINLGNAENGFLIAHEGTTTATFATNGNLTITGALIETSSIKVKENVQTSEGNLEKVVNLRPVTYNKIGSQTTELGLIAEEVAEVYPEFVQYDESGEPVGVHYSRLTAALIGAVKELTNQVQELNKKING